MTQPRLLLHIEGLVMLIGAAVAYAYLGGSGVLFALLLFVPDVFMIGYARDVQLGATIYNIGHAYVLPVMLLGIGFAATWELGVLLGLIWLAHIGLDRTLGYGLKYPTEFKDTHMGHV